MFHPKGGLVRKLMEDYSRAEHEAAGYEFVYTPAPRQVDAVRDLAATSSWYAEGMYPPMEMEGATYYPKPMNCPIHMLIYRRQPRSYRELPLRLFEFGTVYRYERSGVLHGLTAGAGLHPGRRPHLLHARAAGRRADRRCSPSCCGCCATFGFDDFEAELATRPGEVRGRADEEWDEATEAPARRRWRPPASPYVVAEGEGAFYAPKIDVHVRDAIGRRWQLSTLQVDFQLPQRFDLEYVGRRQRPPPARA